jgi:hypothetical protein
MIESGEADAATIAVWGDPDSNDYKSRQIRSSRTHWTLSFLQETFRQGKAPVWKRTRGRWQSIPYTPWEPVYAEFLDGLQAHYIAETASPGNLLIEKSEFDHWVRLQPQVAVEPNDPLGEEKPVGRPGFDWDLFSEELARWEQDGTNIPDEKRGFRESICRALHEWICQTYPNQKAPKIETIKNRLKADLDRIGDKI